LDFVKVVSSISHGRAFASEAGFGRSRYTTYCQSILKAEYLLQMDEIKENLPRKLVIRLGKLPLKAGEKVASGIPSGSFWRIERMSGGKHYGMLGTNRMVRFALHPLCGIGTVKKKESRLGQFIP
jgi:hypothetical protein